MSTQECEKALAETIAATWERIRSSDELQSLIGRRELALSVVETDEFADIV